MGAIAIALSGWVIANPTETALLYVAFIGFALLMVGLSKIMEGIISRQLPKSIKAISIVIGIISIIGGIFTLVNPIAAVVTLIMIISIVILIHGLGLVATGVADSSLGRGSRVANIILGILAIAVSASIHAMPGLVVAMTLILASLGLLFHGIASIISGIIGQKLAFTKSNL